MMTLSKMCQRKNCHDVNLGCLCHVSLQPIQMHGAWITMSRAEHCVFLVSFQGGEEQSVFWQWMSLKVLSARVAGIDMFFL